MLGYEDIIQILVSGVTNGSIYSLVAIAITITFNTTAIMNLAQGEFVMLGGMLMVGFYWLKIPILLALIFTLIIITLIGGIIERVIIRPKKNSSLLTLVVITVGLSMIISGGAMVIWGKETYTFPLFLADRSLRIGTLSIAYQNIFVLAITLIMGLCLYIFFDKTITGKSMRATAENKEVTSLLGINTDHYSSLAFMLSAFVGALAGIIITPVIFTSFDKGLHFVIKGFLAVVIGGLGSSLGAFLGGYIFGIVESLSGSFISSAYKDAISAILLLLILFIRPSGIFRNAK